MRLTSQQIAVIREIAADTFGEQARVWLFGSRVDDNAAGGDVDLLVETPRRPPLKLALRAQGLLEQRLNMPVDLITSSPESKPTPIVNIARLTGVVL